MHTLIFVIVLALYYGNLYPVNLPEYEIEEQELYTTKFIVYIFYIFKLKFFDIIFSLEKSLNVLFQ